MNCELTATALHGYFDGELDAVRAAEFERHVEKCVGCRESLKALRALREGLQKSDLYQPASLRLRSGIAKQLENGPGKKAANWRPFLVPAFSIAMGIVVAWVGFLLLQPRTYSAHVEAELIDAHVRSLQPGHLADVQSTDQHTVKPWFDGKLDFIPPVSDFSQQGFPLLGGRLDVINGHNVAVLVYGRRKHVINLFVWPAGKSGPEINSAGARQGYNWLIWAAGGMQFCAVSDAALADLRELKDLVHP